MKEIDAHLISIRQDANGHAGNSAIGESQVVAESVLIPGVPVQITGRGLEVSCRADKAVKFHAVLDIYRQLQLDNGGDEDKITEGISRFEAEFSQAKPDRQKQLVQHVSNEVDGKLKVRFSRDLDLLHDVKRENGYSSTNVGEDEQVWRVLFDQGSRTDRLSLARDVRTELGKTMIAHFDYYTSSWERTLLASGKTDEEVNHEIKELQHKFEVASERGKVGIAKTTREKVQVALEIQESSEINGRFSAFLEMYAKQIAEKGLDGDDYPTPESIRNQFEQADIKRRPGLCSHLESLTIRATTTKPVGFPHA